MKASFAILALCGLSTLAMAEESQTKVAAQQTRVEEYKYGTHLDIAKAISTSQITNVCQVVPARMVYEDSQGKQHIMSYQVMGNGSSNG